MAVKILGYDFSVLFVGQTKLKEEYCGRCDSNSKTIEILKGLDQQVACVTFLHELLHAILDATGQKHSEKLIEALSRGLFQVMQDNGDLLKPVKQHYAELLREEVLKGEGNAEK